MACRLEACFRMGPWYAVRMTKEEFILTRLRDEAAMYRGIGIVYMLCAVACVVMGVANSIINHENLTSVYLFGLAVMFGFMAAADWNVGKGYARALEEVEADPEGVAYPEDYSVRTASVVAKIQLPMKDYRSMFFAYGIIALMLFAGGAVIAGIYFYMEDNLLYLVVGIGTIFGGVLLAMLSAQAWRNWHAVKRFEQQAGPANVAQ